MILQKKQMKPTQILVLGFFSIILLGTFILMLPISSAAGNWTSIVDAFFTATSAVCVTGLVVVDTGTYWSYFGKTIILLLIQVGGLGFMTMTISVAIFLGKKIGLKDRILMQEALNQFSISGVIRLTKYIFIMTLLIESIGALLLSFWFVPKMGYLKGIYYSIFHAISAFCNAGFDIMGNGIGMTPFATNYLVSLTLIALIILGGLGFAVIADFFKNQKTNKYSLHTKLVLSITGGLILIGWIGIFLLEMNNHETIASMRFSDKLLASLFHGVTPRTAGFNTLDLSSMTRGSQMLTIFLMFIGGSPGSTAGGVKTTTFAITVMTIVSVIKGRDDLQIMHRRISKQIVNRGLAVIFVSTIVISLVLFALLITEPLLDFKDIVFEVFSAFGTVGLSLGITSSLSSLGKLLISALMFFGRLGPLTIVLAISASGNKKTLIKYPEGKIIVG